MSKISVASLGTGNKDGFLTKRGGSIKTWHRRWFVLKGDTLFYFKAKTDTEHTGAITLEPTSVCKEEPKKKKDGFYFSVSTTKRTYFIYADTQKEQVDWMKAISEKIKEKAGSPASPATNQSGSSSAPAEPKKEVQETKKDETTTPQDSKEEKPAVTATETPTPKETKDAPEKEKPVITSSKGGVSPRVQISLAKGTIPFLQNEDSKVLEFWQIWSESVPLSEELQPGMAIEFHVSTSADMEKLTWRTAGPQNIFIQKMVDFFWNVGAPESEIDRLNDVGALINPIKIGSWIDMSGKGGMDGGWYFPVEIPLKMAIEAADPGEPSKKVAEWAEKHNVEKCYSVGRDMGAAPPRQTEMRLRIPGDSAQAQLNIGLDAFTMFGFPPIPDNAMTVLRQDTIVAGLCLSVITSSEGFVRLGLLVPQPTLDTVQKLSQIVNARHEELTRFQSSLGPDHDGPSYVEYQFLKEGFGYGVYKEGFDIVFHYHVGEEKLADD